MRFAGVAETGRRHRSATKIWFHRELRAGVNGGSGIALTGTPILPERQPTPA